ncbi:type II toxin-antitoxin system YafQ family toxin [Patescibacteria group bacterium]|nr:type II toxin-antitoxin system YafQ family toxin [Patescibacteria group bacterium]
MYTVVPSNRFRRALRKQSKSGEKHVFAALAEVVDLLVVHDDRSLYVLSTRWKDHALKGDKKGMRELHLSQDILLLYDIDEKLHMIKLLDIVSHEELRKKR